MKNAYLFLILFALGCTTTKMPPTPSQDFFGRLSTLCNQAYEGKVVFPEGGKDPFGGKALVMRVQSCSPTEIRVPFQVGEDKSRTWVFTKSDQGLLLKHDHRHPDGTPDSVTMYGGYAKAGSTLYSQSFPADDYTAKLIPAAATNEWSTVLSEDRKTFSYILKRDGQLRFQADFDLTKPLSQ
ncbi:hypothetical protein [Hymenobacter qilianensis]|uniref:Uncharacterized protein n=1 Tax=Hymenobacter qilianensis TaxID=1385715 RepID=A0A7H0GWC3_9BACT|nr:hypothetical protein [Hymenobacter qilianensis]QNP52589.1 hypothetical protein H9L05_02140 [Hymenobacter qilianensis]